MTRSAPAPTRVVAALAALRARGERVTRVRHAVVEVLEATTDHLTADEIASRAETLAPGLHRASVYRALATLGEICRDESPDLARLSVGLRVARTLLG